MCHICLSRLYGYWQVTCFVVSRSLVVIHLFNMSRHCSMELLTSNHQYPASVHSLIRHMQLISTSACTRGPWSLQGYDNTTLGLVGVHAAAEQRKHGGGYTSYITHAFRREKLLLVGGNKVERQARWQTIPPAPHSQTRNQQKERIRP
jgi:hypothetical protein